MRKTAQPQNQKAISITPANGKAPGQLTEMEKFKKMSLPSKSG